MRTPALLCDTGALLSYLDAKAPDHRTFRNVIDDARARYLPGLVLAEVDYFLRGDRPAARFAMAPPPTRAMISTCDRCSVLLHPDTL